MADKKINPIVKVYLDKILPHVVKFVTQDSENNADAPLTAYVTVGARMFPSYQSYLNFKKHTEEILQGNVNDKGETITPENLEKQNNENNQGENNTSGSNSAPQKDAVKTALESSSKSDNEDATQLEDGNTQQTKERKTSLAQEEIDKEKLLTDETLEEDLSSDKQVSGKKIPASKKQESKEEAQNKKEQSKESDSNASQTENGKTTLKKEDASNISKMPNEKLALKHEKLTEKLNILTLGKIFILSQIEELQSNLNSSKLDKAEQKQYNKSLKKLTRQLKTLNGKISKTSKGLDKLSYLKKEEETNSSPLQSGNLQQNNLNTKQDESKNPVVEYFRNLKQSKEGSKEQNEEAKKAEEYKEILSRAEKVFKTSSSFNAFKEQVDKAYNSGNLTYVSYASKLFETLYNFDNNNPVHASTLNNLTKDPLFPAFSENLHDLSTPLNASSPLFTGTKEFGEKLQNEVSSSQPTQNIVNVQQKEEVIMPSKPDFSGKIIMPEAGKRGEEHVLTVLTKPEDIVSEKAVDAINTTYQNIATNKDTTQVDVDALNATVEAVTNSTPSDPEAALGITGEESSTQSDIQKAVEQANSDILLEDSSSADLQQALNESAEATAEAQVEAAEEIQRLQDLLSQ